MTLPIPPADMRATVGPRDPEDYDNPTGTPVYPDLPASAYRFVFDFGCGCGRVARKLIQQTPRPARYLGIDPHRGMIDWASANLSPAAPGFAFAHHDVYSPGYAPGNGLRLADRFPVGDNAVSLLIAHSVFTHLTEDQAGFYLSEVARCLAPDGVAFTSWFFFDNPSCPFLPVGPFALYASEKDFSTAVLFDRRWFLATVRKLGLCVNRTRTPALPGHQWEVWLGRRTATSVDQFPIGDDGAEWVCGATAKPMAAVRVDEQTERATHTGSRYVADGGAVETAPAMPALFGPLAELAAVRAELAATKAELSKWRQRALLWRAARKVARLVKMSG